MSNRLKLIRDSKLTNALEFSDKLGKYDKIESRLCTIGILGFFLTVACGLVNDVKFSIIITAICILVTIICNILLRYVHKGRKYMIVSYFNSLSLEERIVISGILGKKIIRDDSDDISYFEFEGVKIRI